MIAWLKTFHIIFMVMWFAGLFYLPRLFVYHAMSTDTISLERFKVMERKLFAIMSIGAVGTLIVGVWMLIDYAWSAYSNAVWLHIKLLLVVILVAYHGLCLKIIHEFRADNNHRDHKFYRWFNEFPVLILFGVVIMVMVRPF